MIRKAVGAIVYDNEDRYLLVHKVKVMDGKDSKIQMDSWDFDKLTNIETKDYWNKYFQGSLK